MNLSELFDDLVRVEIVLWDAVDRRLRAEVGLPLGRVEALRVVATSDPCRVQDVAVSLRITVGAASKLTDRLVTGGLVERRAHPTDRRSSLLRATETGEQAHAAATVAIEDELGRLLHDDDVAGLRPVVAGLRARLAPR
ncbi:MarR family transcriptional regulator [Actinomycetospora endophytica]|uniref:MarR family transcriptional regulator n=1 Tax=Actinomycetospora endophytica TaxID=2291215 RepID=A0ABS8PEA1_9PSEU|nr:MarR family transcriptional regulator [Actinomycetospora endophytica]MCD2196600.1 MarR family transcriptional regulator [Actinomycetospora endophytica]